MQNPQLVNLVIDNQTTCIGDNGFHLILYLDLGQLFNVARRLSEDRHPVFANFF